MNCSVEIFVIYKWYNISIIHNLCFTLTTVRTGCKNTYVQIQNTLPVYSCLDCDALYSDGYRQWLWSFQLTLTVLGVGKSQTYFAFDHQPMCSSLTLILLTWRTWWTPTNARKWEMGYNSVFKGLKHIGLKYSCVLFVWDKVVFCMFRAVRKLEFSIFINQKINKLHRAVIKICAFDRNCVSFLHRQTRRVLTEPNQTVKVKCFLLSRKL